MAEAKGLAGVVRVAAVLLLFLAGTAQAATRVSIVHGNVVCRNDDGRRVLTTDGKNDAVVLSPDERTIAFIKVMTPTMHPEFPDDQVAALWAGDCRTGKIRKLLAPVPGRGRPEDQYGPIGSPLFSLDGRQVYFSSMPGGDHLAIHRVDVRTGDYRFVAYAELDSVLRTGPYRGDLLVTQHTDLVDGAGNHYGGYPYYIFRPDGSQIMRIPGSENWDDKARNKWLKQKGWRAW